MEFCSKEMMHVFPNNEECNKQNPEQKDEGREGSGGREGSRPPLSGGAYNLQSISTTPEKEGSGGRD